MAVAQGRARGAYRAPAVRGAGEEVSSAVLLVAVGFVLMMAAAAIYNIRFLPIFLALGTMLCVAVPVIRWPVATSAAWILLAGTSPEMWLGDVIGEANTITAIVKVLGLALLAVCMIRYGARFDFVNPALAFAFMFITGLAHGLWPTMTLMDSVRSLIGSAAPFAFSFSRLSRRWCNAVIGATIWTPLFIVGFGIVLAAIGWRPLFSTVEGATRLQGSTHPAFLGGFAATAIYAGLVELYRDGRRQQIWLLVVNYIILLASGARAPLAVALLVTAAAFFFLPSRQFPARRRVPLLLGGLLLVPVAIGVASGSTSIRLLEVLSNNGSSLSGRDLIWPYFEAAWNNSPWVGWGIGAGKSVVDPDSLLAKLLGTTAAHNEYLRMGVDGGYIGLALLIVLMALWVIRGTRRARWTDRFIMRMVFLAFAIHSVTDNTLIAATASVMFAWVSAVFARSELEAETARKEAGAAGQRHKPLR
jgi:O-antigen ligase